MNLMRSFIYTLSDMNAQIAKVMNSQMSFEILNESEFMQCQS